MFANLKVTSTLTFCFFNSTAVRVAQATFAEKAPPQTGSGFILKLQKTKDTSIFLCILRIQKSNFTVHLAVPRPLAGGIWHLWYLPKADFGDLGDTKSSEPSPHWARAYQDRFYTCCTLQTFSCVIWNMGWSNTKLGCSRAFILLLRSPLLRSEHLTYLASSRNLFCTSGCC